MEFRRAVKNKLYRYKNSFFVLLRSLQLIVYMKEFFIFDASSLTLFLPSPFSPNLSFSAVRETASLSFPFSYGIRTFFFSAPLIRSLSLSPSLTVWPFSRSLVLSLSLSLSLAF